MSPRRACCSPKHWSPGAISFARKGSRATRSTSSGDWPYRDRSRGREREIVALLADALSNRRIAEKLVLSERTVEGHVRSILANRTEVVAWASREGLRD
ncbi:LuxR C-terminal-related transcriptional regulator [Amycolatopsis coloradensis]|uniref:LuxR C-terminal-related transcriptional regulator n=1 Tax=Amycolatopsis coloradensis TaxID=76021 RepID=A0ACD5BKW0_9PSEU